MKQLQQRTLQMRKLKAKERSSTADLEKSLESHEAICVVRYENIEKRLDSGSAKFKRLENLIFGVYILIISAQIIAELM